MRKTLFFMLALPLVFAACNKSTPASSKCGYALTSQVAGTAETAALKAYLDANSITYTQHPSGIFYNITAAGSGAVPGACSDVTVRYKGSLTNGTGFDSSYVRDPAGSTFTLGALIPGWQIGIPLIQKGGSITLYIPPSLAYGSNAYGSIPANSNLVFKIDLVDVQ